MVVILQGIERAHVRGALSHTDLGKSMNPKQDVFINEKAKFAHDQQQGPIRVMIIENHEIISWGLRKLIEEQRPSMELVAVACSPSAEIFRAARAAPDVILLKYDFVRAYVEDRRFQALKQRGCRTLLLTENLTHENVQISLRSGAHGLLTRKTRVEEVIKAIETTYSGELWFDREASGIALNALREQERNLGSDDMKTLTRRERNVLRAVVENKVRTNKDLAHQLFISESTLRNHLSSIYRKLGVSNRLDLYVHAQKRNIVPNFAEEPDEPPRFIRYGKGLDRVSE